jgi:hypothetical protein
VSSRLAANSLANQLPKTHSPGDTGKGDRSSRSKSYSVLCGFRGAGHGHPKFIDKGRANPPEGTDNVI